MNRRTLISCSLALLGLATLSSSASVAQEVFPSKPITLIMPYGAGGGPDVTNRMMADLMRKRQSLQMIVENKPGANATLGAAYVARAKPDGYTILYGSNANLAAAQGFFKSLPYDPIRDFAGITLVGEQYFALLLRNEFKGISFTQFLERAKKNPELFPIGGPSASYETAHKMMQNAARLDNTYVRYADSGKMMNDLFGGRLAGAFQPLSGAYPSINNGQAYAVAVTATQRVPTLLNVSTMHEVLPGVALSAWTGHFAPARTPRPIIELLHTKLVEVLNDPEIRKRNEESGRALFLTPDETDAWVRKETPRWLSLLKAAGIEPE